MALFDDDEKAYVRTDEKADDRAGAIFDPKQIISIDFGSFGSTAAFCLPQSPAKYVVVSKWEGMSTCDAAMQKKTLTALLFDTNRKKVIAYGYHAQTLYFDYSKIMKDTKKTLQKKKNSLKKKFGDETIKLAFFKHFKPHLVGDDPLRKDKYIWSTDRATKLSIFDLITYSLIEIKKQSLKEAEKFRKDAHLDLDEHQVLKEDEVLWAISTPSVWDDTSRGAFKECVISAGMKHHVIGLEPEFALFCMSKADQADFLDNDKKYIVLDCGGGTVDATCVELIGGGAKMEETLPRKGIDIGSLDIDDEYYKMLEGVLGEAFVRQFQEQYPHHWNGVQTSFWKAKHIVDATKFADTGLHVDVPRAFWKSLKAKFRADDDAKEDDFEEYVCGLFEKYCKRIYGDDGAEYIEYEEEDDSINIQIAVWHDFHTSVLDNVCSFVESLLTDDSMTDCENIILVGGLSQSKFLQQRLRVRFGDGIDEYDTRKIKFNSAKQPSWAVTIGGLFWTYNRKNYQRRMWLTYGFEVNRPCDKSEINKHRDINSSTGYIKKHVFDPLFFKNDPFDDHHKEIRNYTIPFDAGTLTLNLYAVDDKRGVYYTTDTDEYDKKKCHIAAQYELKLKDEKWLKWTQQTLPIRIEFEETMLRILITQPDLHQHEMIIKNPKIKK